MTWTIRFQRQAQGEFDAAADWFEAQRPGLGGEFYQAVDAALQGLRDSGHRRAPLHADIRGFATPRFPYYLYYRLVRDEIIVIAVLHRRRDPAAWRARR